MRFEEQWIDVSRHLALQQQPVVMLDRARFGRSEVWVPQGSPLDEPKSQAEADNFWRVTRVGEKIRVPVFAIRTARRAVASVWSAGLQVGLAAMTRLLAQKNVVPDMAILVLGHVCTELDDAIRCYAGLALVVGSQEVPNGQFISAEGRGQTSAGPPPVAPAWAEPSQPPWPRWDDSGPHS